MGITRVKTWVNAEVLTHTALNNEFDNICDNVEMNADVTDSTNVNAAGAVMNTDFSANTLLYATTNNTPAVKTRAETLALLSGQAAATFDMNTQKISGIVDPTTDQQAATKKYVDDNMGAVGDKIIEGDTYAECVDTGDGYITFVEDGGEIARITGNTLDMKSHKIVNVTDPTANQEAATKKYVDDNTGSAGSKIIEGDTYVECIDAADGYITFVEDGAEISRITGSALDMKTHKIINVVDPTELQEAATKKYVDDNMGAVGDKIIEGDTSVECVDTGDGYIVFTEDGAEVGRFTGGDLTLENGLACDDHFNLDGHANYVNNSINCYSATDWYASRLRLRKSGSDTEGTMVATVDNESWGYIQGHGVNSSSDFASGADIVFGQDGAAGATYLPGEIKLRVGTNTAAVSDILTITSGGLSMNTHKITGVVDPTADQEAATKKYVDDNASGASDVAYDSTWDGVTTIAPSKNAIWDWTKPYDVTISAPPSSLGNHNSITTAFDGDISKLQFPVKHMITGDTTAGQPTSGYSYCPEIMPHYTYLYNSSGYNHSTSSNAGRTGICAYKTSLFQAGQGDLVCYNAGVYVHSTKAGSTSFLANPAGVILNGDAMAGVDGAYLNVVELNLVDNGYDAAGIGIVMHFERTNATGAKGVRWDGIRLTSSGSQSCCSAYMASGKWAIGLDLTPSTLDGNRAAICMGDLDKIYLNSTADNWSTTGFGNSYVCYNHTVTKVHIAPGAYVSGDCYVTGNLESANTVKGATLALSTGTFTYSGGYIYANTHLRTNGQMRCSQFRIDQNPTGGGGAATHRAAIEVNGVAYYVLLQSV